MYVAKRGLFYINVDLSNVNAGLFHTNSGVEMRTNSGVEMSTCRFSMSLLRECRSVFSLLYISSTRMDVRTRTHTQNT